jgi:uncharacterized protein (DUF1330 family)
MPAFLIANIEVGDARAFQAYLDGGPAVVARFGGRYVLRGGRVEVLEGAWRPTRVVVIEFEDVETVRSFWSSPDYQALVPARDVGSTEVNLVIVDPDG